MMKKMKFFRLKIALFFFLLFVTKASAESLFSDFFDLFQTKIDGCGSDSYSSSIKGCVLEKYTPPDGKKYSFTSEINVDFPYEKTYQIVKTLFTVYEENAEDGILRVGIKNEVERSNFSSRDTVTISPAKEIKVGYTSDCGDLIFRGHGDITLKMYPTISMYEIKLSKKESRTLINISYKGVSRWIKRQAYENCTATEEDFSKLKKINLLCASTGMFEEYAFNAIQSEIDAIIKKEERKKIEQEERQRRIEAEKKRKEDQEERERIKKERELALRNALTQEFLPKCNGTILSLYDFIAGKNPYADKGKCVLIQAATFQMTSEKAGLFQVGDQMLYIEFPQIFRGPYVRAIVNVKGVYTYPTRLGSTNTVPHLQVLKELSSDEYYSLEK